MSVLDLDREAFLKKLSAYTYASEVFDNAPRIYDYLSELFDEKIMDSLLREWTFQWYSEQTGDDYDVIYEKWLGVH